MSADVGEAWRSLSYAAHHHAYELSPTLTELVAWRIHVERLIGELTTASPGVD
jgi:hypothetical protein